MMSSGRRVRQSQKKGALSPVTRPQSAYNQTPLVHQHTSPSLPQTWANWTACFDIADGTRRSKSLLLSISIAIQSLDISGTPSRSLPPYLRSAVLTHNAFDWSTATTSDIGAISQTIHTALSRLMETQYSFKLIDQVGWPSQAFSLIRLWLLSRQCSLSLLNR